MSLDPPDPARDTKERLRGEAFDRPPLRKIIPCNASMELARCPPPVHLRHISPHKEAIMSLRPPASWFLASLPKRGIPLLALLTLIFLLPLMAQAQESISEVTVIFGGSSSIQAPPGYTKINVDLNQDAGGDYIYLCYKKGVGAPITGLAVTYNNNLNLPGGYQDWTRVDVDLNRGAGGAYIWLWYTKDPACTTIDDIVVNTSMSAVPAGYETINADLNYSVGGAYIWLSFRRI
jgi:hypothetical protein